MAAVFFGLFLLSAWQLLIYYAEGQKQEKGFRQLEQTAAQPESQSEDTATSESAAEELTEKERAAAEYQTLHAKNPDFWGWLKIEGTQLSYPVMDTPEDPEHYLYRDFEGNSSKHGVPFRDGSCTESGENDIIYGHNMKDGTMFATLLSYKDSDFFQKHPTITLNTAEGLGTYAVMAVFYARVYEQGTEGGFRYYQYADLSDSERFNEYVKLVREESLYDTGIHAQPGDRLLTLSTCSYHTKNGRFVVVARKR